MQNFVYPLAGDVMMNVHLSLTVLNSLFSAELGSAFIPLALNAKVEEIKSKREK